MSNPSWLAGVGGMYVPLLYSRTNIPEHSEARQRWRHCGISVALIHGIALMEDMCGRDSFAVALYALETTFVGNKPKNWYVDGEEIQWTIHRDPVAYWDEYESAIYHLEVTTSLAPTNRVNQLALWEDL